MKSRENGGRLHPEVGSWAKNTESHGCGNKKRGCRTTRLKNLVVWQLFFQKKGKNSAPAEFF